MRIALPYLMWRRSAMSSIPVSFGLARCGDLRVDWRHKQWQCSLLHISDSVDALEAVRPSMFADIHLVFVCTPCAAVCLDCSSKYTFY